MELTYWQLHSVLLFTLLTLESIKQFLFTKTVQIQLDNLTEVRTVMSNSQNNGLWEFKGSVLPDSSGDDAAYSIDVELGGYSLYGQFVSCQEVVFVNSTDAEGNEHNRIHNLQSLL